MRQGRMRASKLSCNWLWVAVWVPGFIRLSRTDDANEEDCLAYETWRCFRVRDLKKEKKETLIALK